MSRRRGLWLVAALAVGALLAGMLLTPLLMISGLMASASSTLCSPAGAVPVTVVAGEWTSPVAGQLTSPFGMRVHPVTGIRKLHDGQDIGAPYGTVVVAAAAGTVTVSASGWAGPHLVTIDHGGGVQTLYGHMSAALVTTGQQVVAGQPIGKVGSEGLSTGAHLHVTVRVAGQAVDPMPFFAARGVRLGSPPGRPDASTATPAPQASVVPAGSLHTDPAQLPDTWTTASSNGATITLDATQLGFAVTFARQGAEMGVPAAGIQIAFMVVFTESGWRNYANPVYPETLGRQYPQTAIGSDHDSVGLTQARPEAGWGTPVGLMDPAAAAAAFYGGPEGPNRGSPKGLLDLPGWQGMQPGDAAQAVQVSAFPDRYAAWQDAARALLQLVGGTGAGVDVTSCVFAHAEGSAFRAATLNLLGDSHTRAGGKRSSWRSGSERIPGQLAALDAADVSIAGLQEVQRAQHSAITGQYADTWGIYPDRPGAAQNVVIWRLAEWRLVQARTFEVPYFDGHPAPQALVQLQSLTTGASLWAASVHNPADLPAHPHQSAHRADALRIELALIRELAATAPVLLTGDFNDVDEPHCTFTPLMANAYGPGQASPCRAPDLAGIDQVFLTGAGTLTQTLKDRTLIGRELTDHPLVSTTVQLGTPPPAGPTVTAAHLPAAAT